MVHRLIIAGMGNVGRDLIRLLASDREWTRLFKVVAVATGRHGVVVDEQGIDLHQLLGTVEAGRSLNQLGVAPAATTAPGADTMASSVPLSVPPPSTLDLIKQVPADILVELTPLSIADGRPAIDHIEAALRTGKHAVTANKGPVAWDYARLHALAEGAGRRFLFESAVMDGVPVFNLSRAALRGCRVVGFRGILNSTTNFILERLESGGTYDAAVAEAQRQGFAEADPTLDVDGWDAAAKVAALANVLMDARIDPMKVDRTGIRGVKAGDVAAAARRGGRLKLICAAERSGVAPEGGDAGVGPGAGTGTSGGGVITTVRPEFVPLSDPFALVSGTSSILTLKTDLLGDITVVENDPKVMQTAYGVLNDLLEIAGWGGR